MPTRACNWPGSSTSSRSARAAGRTQRWVETDTSEAFLPDVNLEGVRWTVVPVARPDSERARPADIVGISCGFDVLVQDALLPEPAAGDLLAFLDTGAYQDAGSNNFNAMPRPATVLVHGDEAEVVKRAETGADVFRRDLVPARFGPVRVCRADETLKTMEDPHEWQVRPCRAHCRRPRALAWASTAT